MHYGNEKHFLKKAGGVLIPFREVRGLPDLYTQRDRHGEGQNAKGKAQLFGFSEDAPSFFDADRHFFKQLSSRQIQPFSIYFSFIEFWFAGRLSHCPDF